MKVAILGCGPAGLIAAHVVEEHGHEPVIYSKKQRSPIGGAQYLHESIEGLTAREPDGYLTFMKMGTSEGYAKKVYGKITAPTSWQHFADGSVGAWSLRPIYEGLWLRFEKFIVPMNIGSYSVADFTFNHHMVISTIPKLQLCLDQDDHLFQKQPIVLVPAGMHPLLNNCIIYSGRNADPWYRMSRIFGESWTEFALRGHEDEGWPWIKGQVNGFKPTGNNCDCHPEIFHVGRFGRWGRGVLLHHVAQEVSTMIQVEGHVVQ